MISENDRRKLRQEALLSCTALRAVSADASTPDYASDEGVLFDKSKTKLLRYPAGKSGNFYAAPSCATEIADHAFARCNRLTSVSIPGKVTKIGHQAFAHCDGLRSVDISGSVTKIGDYAFAWCHKLASVNIPAGVTGVGNYAFYNCSHLRAIHVDAANPVYASDEGVLFNKSKTKLLCYPAVKGDLYAIPAGVTEIGHHAFACCRLTDLRLRRKRFLSSPDDTYINSTSPDSCTLRLTTGHTTFENTPLDSCTLHVPKGTKALYEAAPVWKDFGTIKENVG